MSKWELWWRPSRGSRNIWWQPGWCRVLTELSCWYPMRWGCRWGPGYHSCWMYRYSAREFWTSMATNLDRTWVRNCDRPVIIKAGCISWNFSASSRSACASTASPLCLILASLCWWSDENVHRHWSDTRACSFIGGFCFSWRLAFYN